MKLFFIIFFLPLTLTLKGQDPHFTQFYAAPLTVNPAYTGVFNGQLRFITNMRQQWTSSSSPYNTYTLALDTKVGKRALEGQNPLNFGVMFMDDNSLNGALKSTYVTGTASYHVPLDEDGYHSIGAGLSGTYGSRRINFADISFSNQFTSNGFNLSLPSGEMALNNMKPFVSVGAGLLYQYYNVDQGNFFDLGVSGYHFNKPKQTIMADPNEFLPIRISLQASFVKYLTGKVLLNVKALYQRQGAVEYILGGLSLEQLLGPDLKYMVGAGLWYRSADALSPYIRIGIDKFTVGMSYDVTISDLKRGPSPARSWELSFQYVINKRGMKQ